MLGGQSVLTTSLRRGKHMKIKISDIKIPEYFSPPNDDKYREKEHVYLKSGYLRPIVLNHDNVLEDGYISYLILKRSGAREVEYVSPEDDGEMVTYITGSHLNSKKEYIWMVPRKRIRSFAKHVGVGDRVFCYSNKRVAPVIVKSIFTAPKNDKFSQVAGW